MRREIEIRPTNKLTLPLALVGGGGGVVLRRNEQRRDGS
jgi:hypothetical protein